MESEDPLNFPRVELPLDELPGDSTSLGDVVKVDLATRASATNFMAGSIILLTLVQSFLVTIPRWIAFASGYVSVRIAFQPASVLGLIS